LLREIGTPSLNDCPDEFTWAFEPSGKFSVKSLYRNLSVGDPRKHYVVIWKIYVPLKIWIFLWQLSLKRLPPSDNIKKLHGSTNGNCTLCGEYEDTNHIFFQCAPARFMWSIVRKLLSTTWNPRVLHGRVPVDLALEGTS
jgi:hypothetical protein